MLGRRVERRKVQAVELPLDARRMFAHPGILHRPVVDEGLERSSNVLRALGRQKLQLEVEYRYIGRDRRVRHHLWQAVGAETRADLHGARADRRDSRWQEWVWRLSRPPVTFELPDGDQESCRQIRRVHAR